MELQETQTKKTESHVLSAENIHDYINSEKIRESEPITHAQTDNAITIMSIYQRILLQHKL